MRGLRATVAIGAGFAAMFVVNALMAVAVIDPLFSDRYPEVVGESPGLDLPLLALGYFGIAAAIGVLVHWTAAARGRIWSGLAVGAAVAVASFVGVHTVQTGYTIIDNEAWLLSGLLDAPGPIVAGLVAALVLGGAADSPADRLSAELDRRIGTKATGNRLQRQIHELERVSGRIDEHLTRLRAGVATYQATEPESEGSSA